MPFTKLHPDVLARLACDPEGNENLNRPLADELLAWARIAEREGLLTLDEKREELEAGALPRTWLAGAPDRFLRASLEMAIEFDPVDELENVLVTMMACSGASGILFRRMALISDVLLAIRRHGDAALIASLIDSYFWQYPGSAA